MKSKNTKRKKEEKIMKVGLASHERWLIDLEHRISALEEIVNKKEAIKQKAGCPRCWTEGRTLNCYGELHKAEPQPKCANGCDLYIHMDGKCLNDVCREEATCSQGDCQPKENWEEEGCLGTECGLHYHQEDIDALKKQTIKEVLERVEEDLGWTFCRRDYLIWNKLKDKLLNEL